MVTLDVATHRRAGAARTASAAAWRLLRQHWADFWDGFFNAPRYMREGLWAWLGYCPHYDVPRGHRCDWCGADMPA